MRHLVAITYKSGAKDRIDLCEHTYYVWSIKCSDRRQEHNAVAKGAVLFGYTKQQEPVILKLEDASGIRFYQTPVDNPMEDTDHYNNPLN